MRVKSNMLGGAALVASLSDTRANGSQERLVGANGELNASNFNELIARQLEIANLIASGSPVVTQSAETAATSAERRAALVDAMNDKSGVKFAELGAAIAAEVQDRVRREGFMR
jgi:hypothetical protein